jgi:hypothetical protein
MSLSYRKSKKIAPGLKLNMSSRGVGVSAGPRGAKVSANTKGQKRASAGLFGFRWSKQK